MYLKVQSECLSEVQMWISD